MTFKNSRFVNGWMIVFCLLLLAAIYTLAPHTYAWGAGYGVAFSGVMEHGACFILQARKKQ